MTVPALSHQVFTIVPQLGTAMVDQQGIVAIPWYQFFINLWNSVGGSTTPSSVTLASVQAEAQQAESDAQAAQTTANAAEAATVVNAAAIVTETNRAETAEALLLPKAGVTDGSNAPAGQIGEFLSTTNAYVSLTSLTDQQLASLALTPGDWDLESTAYFNPANTTQVSGVLAYFTETVNVRPTIPGGFSLSAISGIVSTGNIIGLALARTRISTSVPVTIYLSGGVGFTISTCQGAGFMSARRVR